MLAVYSTIGNIMSRYVGACADLMISLLQKCIQGLPRLARCTGRAVGDSPTVYPLWAEAADFQSTGGRRQGKVIFWHVLMPLPFVGR